MLTITTSETELYDEESNIFTILRPFQLRMEHSLVSISKWESKMFRPFLSKQVMTQEEVLLYIQCMTITQNVPDLVWTVISDANYKEIQAYIDCPMSGTTFPSSTKTVSPASSKETPSSELIYYWMIQYNIPFECQTWHLNRLLTLIKVCDFKNRTTKKRRPTDIANDFRALNAARRQELGTKG
jgi:hypothetical protein